MHHLGEQAVLDLVAGALVDVEVAPLHEHLDRCADCRALVAGMLRRDRPLAEAAAAPAALDALLTAAGTPPAATPTRLELAAPRHAPAPRALEHLDEYRVLGLLGRGGMGTVYRAHDTLLDREVALKLVARTDSEAARQRFLVEARAVARIRHPNVVVVHRVGVAADQPYIVYDLVRGRTFGELRAPMPWAKVLELATGVVRGLAAAHACSVLHRDIKPANLMIGEHGDVVLVDFGLAKVAPAAPAQLPSGTAAPPAADVIAIATADTRVTATGTALGTPRYMAPEAWRGQEATPQTDLYSLGVVLYELLAGRPPFAETHLDELARRVCEEGAPSVTAAAPWIPSPFAAVIDRCLARDPRERPSSAAALVEELEELQRGHAFEAFERDRARRAPEGNPYPGPRPFGWEHQGVFFGRSGELRALVEQLRQRPFVVVAGEAGAGKTSLCRAGLLPLLRRGALGGVRKWVPVTVTPGAHPIAALAAALGPHLDDAGGRACPPPGDEGGRVAERLVTDPAPVLAQFRAGHGGGCTAHVLFVDPLDDLLTADPAEARRFAELLGALAQPAPALRVVATVRTQNLLAVAQLPGLHAAIGPAIYLLLEPRDERALRDIVVEPARLGGRHLDDAVAAPLVAAAARGELRLADLEARLAALWDAA